MIQVKISSETRNHLHAHKKTRRLFMCIDASLTCLALTYVFLLSEIVSHFFSFFVLSIAVLFNGYALYSYTMLRHRDVVLNKRWLTQWKNARATICCFEWSMYIIYLLIIGSPVFFYHWLLIFVGFIPIGAGYYKLEKIEHNVGIHSMILQKRKKSSTIDSP